MGRFRQIAVSGLIIVVPLAVTVIAVTWLVQTIAELSVFAGIEPTYLRPPVVILVSILVVLAVGYLMRTTVGSVIVRTITNGINHVPMLRVVYNASRLAVETVFSDETEKTEPILIDAWDGLRVTAFTTGKRTDDGRLICFFPTSPNVTTGYVIEVREEDVTRTGEPLEHALTRLLSAGFGEGADRMGADPPVAGRARRISGVELPSSDR